MKKDGTKLSTLQRLGKQSRSLRFGYFFSGLPNLRKSQPHFEGRRKWVGMSERKK
jgi:hypothetical protein